MATDACREWRGELAAEALGNIEPAARAALRDHVDGCEACRAELRELYRVAAVLPTADATRLDTPEEPLPAGLGDRVAARLRAELDPNRWGGGGRRFAMLLAATVAALAAAALAIVMFGGLFVSSHRSAHMSVTLHGRAVATAKLVDRTSGTEVHFAGTGAGADHWYWLWLTGADGKRVAAGSFRGDAQGRYDFESYCALPYARVRRVWVTDDQGRVVLDARLQPAAA